MGDRLLTILQAAAEFNVTRKLLYRAVACGELAAVRFSSRGRIRLRPRDVEGWIRVHSLGAVDSEPSSAARSPTVALSEILPAPEARRFA